MHQKRYLVACKNEYDCIDLMKHGFLHIKKNVESSDAMMDKKNRLITSKKYLILFRLPGEIEEMRPETLEGVRKSKRYCGDMLVTSNQRQACNKLIELSKLAFGGNDREGFLDYVVNGGRHE